MDGLIFSQPPSSPLPASTHENVRAEPSDPAWSASIGVYDARTETGVPPIDHHAEYRLSSHFRQDLGKLMERAPLKSMWSLHGIPISVIARLTWRSLLADRLFGHAAELGFYFLFALFPTLFCAGSALGLIARSAQQVSDKLLNTLALVIPTSALGAVLETFNEKTAAASSGKVTIGSIAAIWSASVGISAIQDTLNEVYKINDTRSYIVARIYAILLTILLTVLIILGLTCIFGADVIAAVAHNHFSDPTLSTITAIAGRVVAWTLSCCFLALSFAVIYSWAPDWKEPHWRWLTPGHLTAISGWVLASLGFRLYLHFFNSYTLTYGSLGAVIILLTWFYITGLALLLGAEIDNVIDTASGARTPPPSSITGSPENLD